MNDIGSQVVMSDLSPQQMELPLRSEVYTWKIEGSHLARSIRDVRASYKPGLKLEFRVTNGGLTSFHQTSDKRLSISCTVPISESSCFQEESKHFSLDYGIAEKLMHASERWGSTHFRIERKRKWAVIEVDGCVIPLSLKPCAGIPTTQTSTVLGSLNSAQLRLGSRAAAVFRNRKANRSAAKFSLTFRDGFAVHAYAYAAARHPVTTPHDLGVPGTHISNFLQIAARFRGSVALTETEDQFHLRDSEGHDCSWSKEATLLPDMATAFDTSYTIGVELSTSRLQMAATQLAAFTEEIEIKTCVDERGQFFELLGEFRGFPVTSRFPVGDHTVNFACTVKTEDLALACCNVTDDRLTITAMQSGLIVQGVGREAAAQFLLRRFDTGR